MSLYFVRALEAALEPKIADLTKRVMGGALSERDYLKLTERVYAYQEMINIARDLLKRTDDEDEGDEGDNVISAGGRQPRR